MASAAAFGSGHWRNFPASSFAACAVELTDALAMLDHGFGVRLVEDGEQLDPWRPPLRSMRKETRGALARSSS